MLLNGLESSTQGPWSSLLDVMADELVVKLCSSCTRFSGNFGEERKNQVRIRMEKEFVDPGLRFVYFQ